MTKVKKNPIQQKEKLVEQLKDIEKKIASFDEQRASIVAKLAKKYRITDISDDIITTEFKAMRDKHVDNKDMKLTAMDNAKKKS